MLSIKVILWMRNKGTSSVPVEIPLNAELKAVFHLSDVCAIIHNVSGTAVRE